MDDVADAPQVGDKRTAGGRKRYTPAQRLESLKQKYVHVKTGFEAERLWETHQRILCVACGEELAAGTNVSNLKTHFEGNKHAVNVRRSIAAQGGPGSIRTALQHQAVQSAEAAERAVATAQKALVAWACLFIDHSRIPQLFTEEFYENLVFLHKLGVRLSAGAVAIRLHDVVEDMKQHIRQRVAGNPVSILIEEASTIFTGRQRSMAIALASTLLPKPVLLDVIFDVGGEGKPAERAAACIRKTLEGYGIKIHTQVTSLAGDNVTFNDAIAEILGMPRVQTIPHALQQVFKALTKPFKGFETITKSLSTILNAGAGIRRVKSLEFFGIQTSKLLCNPTRWIELQAVARYLQQPHSCDKLHEGYPFFGVYETLRRAMVNNRTFGDRWMGDEDEITDEDTPTAPVKQHLAQVLEAFDVGNDSPMHFAQFECILVEEIMGSRKVHVSAPEGTVYEGGIPELIAMANAETESINVKQLFDKLEILRLLLEAVANGAHCLPIHSAISNSPTSYNEHQQDTLKARYTSIVKDAAAAALQVFNKYMPDAIAAMKRRVLYDPSNAPPELPPNTGEDGFYKVSDMEGHTGEDGFYKVSDLEAFFGCVRGSLSTALVVSYNRYRKAWPTLPLALKSLGIARFWRTPEIAESYSMLAKLAIWHATLPTSSVAVDHLFSTLRTESTTEDTSLPQQCAHQPLSDVSFIRCNKWLRPEMYAMTPPKLDSTAAAVPAPTTAAEDVIFVETNTAV